jgi:molecular chaperone HscB
MNHFDLYEIPVSFIPDPAAVKKKFYELSRKYHPDFYGQAGEAEQAEALEKSSQVNQAFKILSNPEAVIKYVLQLKGLLEEEEKYQLDPEFLMEMMELNELAMETDDRSVVEEKIKTTQQQLYADVAEIIEHYKEALSSEKELLQVKDYYYRKKYLERIREGLK